MQEALIRRGSRSHALPLASFASMVVAVDESDLAAVAQLCDDVALLPNKSQGLLVGKLSALFDLRRQQWLHVQFLSDPFGNGTLNALLLLESLPKASLILADLGYFGFAWFQYLTEQGHFWLSRLKSRTSSRIVHILYQHDDTLDALIWLGTSRSDQHPSLVRLVQYRQGSSLHRSITNVVDPSVLPLREVPVLYGRRWDIEMAFKLLKRTLGLHVWWACERVLILQQLLLALSLAQVIHFLQGEIAAEAGVEPLDVSLDILMKVLPYASWPCPEGMVVAVVGHARRLGLIRPSRYWQLKLPDVLAQDIQPLPPDAPRCRPTKQTIRKRPRHPRRTDPFDFRFFPLLLI